MLKRVLVLGKKYQEQGFAKYMAENRAYHKFTTRISGYFLPGTSTSNKREVMKS